MQILAVTTCCVLAFCATASAQLPRESPRELAALAQYVGDWTSDVTSKPAEWTPQEIKFCTLNHAEFVLEGWFLRHIEVNHVVGHPGKVTKSLFLWTYDSDSRKYVGWAFQSSGDISKMTGIWNAVGKMFTHSATERPPNAAPMWWGPTTTSPTSGPSGFHSASAG